MHNIDFGFNLILFIDWTNQHKLLYYVVNQCLILRNFFKDFNMSDFYRYYKRIGFLLLLLLVNQTKTEKSRSYLLIFNSMKTIVNLIESNKSESLNSPNVY